MFPCKIAPAMTKKTFGFLAFMSGLSVALPSCGPDNNVVTDTWDREAMLIHWRDEIILPAWEAYAEQTADLEAVAGQFSTNPSAAHLTILRDQFASTYVAWQRVSLLELGPGESAQIKFRSNTFPTDTALVASAASAFTGANAPNLLLPSTFDQQGFPALDFLLHRTADAGTAAAEFAAEPGRAAYVAYLCGQLNALAQDVHAGWASYGETFVSLSGSSASASVNKLANDFVYHLEKELRAGKVGIPAGVFSAVPMPDRVEAPFKAELARELFEASLEAHRRFFLGISFDSLSQGPSLAQYLDHLGTQHTAGPLSEAIAEDFDLSRQALDQITGTFAETVATDNVKMLTLYDALQRAVVKSKTDMMQALNIKIDYVDADGD